MTGRPWLERYDQSIADGFLAANDVGVGLSHQLGIDLEHFEPGLLRAGLVAVAQGTCTIVDPRPAG